MAFSGGVYTLPTPALVPGQTVSSSENNTVRNDMAASFNLTWLRNGTAAATANIPMGSYKLTGLGAATTSGDALSYGAAAVVSSLTNSGNLTFTGTGNRITGDTNGATIANRLAFQDSVTNATTQFHVLPNGTAVNAGIKLEGSSTATNAASGQIDLFGATDFRINSTIRGSGTYLPMTFYTGGSERMRIDTSGNFGVGTSSPSYPLHVYGNIASASFASAGTTFVTRANGTSASPTAASGVVGRYQALGYDGSSYQSVAQVVAGADGTVSSTNAAGYLAFNTTQTGTVTSTERMRIDSSGNVGIGTSSPNGAANYGWLTVNGSSGSVVSVSVGNTEYGRLVGGSSGTYVSALNSAPLVVQTTTAQPFIVQTNNTERMRIDSSGNVGIGTSSPNAKVTIGTPNTQSSATMLSVAGATQSVGGGSGQVGIYGTDAAAADKGGTLSFTANTTSLNGYAMASISGKYETAGAGVYGGYLQFCTTNSAGSVAERMRINSNGNLLIGCTTEAANETHIVLSTNSGTTRWSVGPWSSVSNNFYITATSAAQGVYLSGTTATSWSALSDERWKTELQPIENAAEKVSTLRAVTGVYTNDADKKRKPFLIAQDVLAVLPEAVDTENPEKYGLAYTEVIPLLVAAIKELKAELDATKAEVAALKGN